jgi:hypothetical protein
LAQLFDGGLERSEKSLAGLTAVEVLLQLFAKRVVHLFVEIIRKLPKERFARRGTLGAQRSSMARNSQPFRAAAVLTLADQLLAYEKARAVQTHAHVPRTKASNLANFFVGQSFHIPKNEDDSVLRWKFLYRLAEAVRLFATNGERLRVVQFVLDFAIIGSAEGMLLPQSLFLLPFVAAVVILFLVWCMRRLSLKAQFLVLLAMGVTLAFLLLMIVQLPEYRSWLATFLVLMVFIASPFAIRICLRSLTQEENEQADEIRKHES